MAGVLIYYAMDGDENPDNLKEIHQIAPVAIIVLFILLLIAQYIKKRRDESE